MVAFVSRPVRKTERILVFYPSRQRHFDDVKMKPGGKKSAQRGNEVVKQVLVYDVGCFSLIMKL